VNNDGNVSLYSLFCIKAKITVYAFILRVVNVFVAKHFNILFSSVSCRYLLAKHQHMSEHCLLGCPRFAQFQEFWHANDRGHSKENTSMKRDA
jgi:hypothetical protein